MGELGKEIERTHRELEELDKPERCFPPIPTPPQRKEKEPEKVEEPEPEREKVPAERAFASDLERGFE